MQLSVELIVIRCGPGHIIWSSLVAILGILILAKIATWCKTHSMLRAAGKTGHLSEEHHHLSKQKVMGSFINLILLVFKNMFTWSL
jgi:FSR family fosmidomycin resistance protein-like MFS transporter